MLKLDEKMMTVKIDVGDEDYSEIEYEEVDESFLEERTRQRRIERLKKELEELEGQGE